jgi:hypothetical protein
MKPLTEMQKCRIQPRMAGPPSPDPISGGTRPTVLFPVRYFVDEAFSIAREMFRMLRIA